METRTIVIIGIGAAGVAAFMFYRSRQAAAMAAGGVALPPSYPQGTASAPTMTYPSGPAPSAGGSPSFTQRAGGFVAGIPQRAVNSAISTTVGSIRSSATTTYNVGKTIVGAGIGAVGGIVSNIKGIF